ncbi:E3 ubiquitin-protein ligase NHLRC1-like [Colossoma macropomum]|uniref:E3 ubiquitin-protein ligase NHLRC1-like n=1 Tax=Colossoma macropomum TaxID=42526 RepID=UPI001864F690|nr:E3 ubiquitin-protein ligase NHLRC1-like [Colossoma macropomum]
MSEALVSRSSSCGRAKGAEEVLAEIRSDLLECKVCFERFSSEQTGRRPRNLPCGHVICLGCVCALAHAVLRQLECPFCRRRCDVGGTYDCQALLDLQDLLGSAERPNTLGSDSSWSNLSHLERGVQSWVEGLGSGLMRLQTAFGGWGELINPTGVAVLGSAAVVVVHGGHKKVTIFNSQGHYLHSFGYYGHGRSELCHPLDVAVTPIGHIVVTDAGDHSVKVFSSRGTPLADFGPFELPWGVDVDKYGRFLVTDAQAGLLWQVVMDHRCNVVVAKVVVLKDLQCPRAVASCRVSGRVAVLEAQRRHSGESIPTRLKLFSEDFVLLTQVDRLSLNLLNPMQLDISYATFDRKGDLIVADAQQGLVWSLSDLQETPTLSPLVKAGLERPVGLVATEQNSLIVLDSGDHTVKIYSASADDLYGPTRSKSI